VNERRGKRVSTCTEKRFFKYTIFKKKARAHPSFGIYFKKI